MSATLIGYSAISFGCPNPPDVFVAFDFSLIEEKDQDEFPTFGDSLVKCFSNSRLRFLISGHSTTNQESENQFKNLFLTDNFAKTSIYDFNLIENKFEYIWETIFREQITIVVYYYITNPNVIAQLFSWPYNATADYVQSVFVSSGFPDVTVTKLTDGAWSISGISNLNNLDTPNYPVRISVVSQGDSKQVIAIKNDIKINVISIKQEEEIDDFMRFEIECVFYEYPMTSVDQELYKLGYRPNPIDYL